MIFRRIVYSALVIGILAGLAFTAAQVLAVNPIIFAAESFELSDAGVHDHQSHSHSDEAWAPADGRERTSYTLLSSVFGAIGFSAMLLAIMSQCQLQGLTIINAGKGLLWGIMGFVTFFIAPGLGLSPEIPGVEAAPVEYRQGWWLLAVISVGLGLALIAFSPLKFKVIGIISIVLPYIIGAPHKDGPLFAHPDPAAVQRLETLHSQFIVASGFSNLLLWLLMGLLSALAIKRWVLVDHATDDKAPPSDADVA
jgi:cobalt transporter subunit CbtA